MGKGFAAQLKPHQPGQLEPFWLDHFIIRGSRDASFLCSSPRALHAVSVQVSGVPACSGLCRFAVRICVDIYPYD